MNLIDAARISLTVKRKSWYGPVTLYSHDNFITLDLTLEDFYATDWEAIVDELYVGPV